MADHLSFDVLLAASNEEAAGFKFHNRPGEVHRRHVTGSDREGATIVVGNLIHVIHGFHSLDTNDRKCPDISSYPPPEDEDLNDLPGRPTPCTLLVFEWEMLPGKSSTSRRFRSVTIDLIFSAIGSRLGISDNNISSFDPVPKKYMPPGKPIKSFFTPVTMISSSGWKGGPTVGYDPFVSVSAEYNRSGRSEVRTVTHCAMSGSLRHHKRTRGEPNVVRFTFLENKPAQTGVERVIRTAVLLQRNDGDIDGKFAMEVNIETEVNWWQDGKEKMRSAVGRKPKDDPVVFDPKVKNVIVDGEEVKRKDVELDVDWRRLWDADLKQFWVGHDEDEGRQAVLKAMGAGGERALVVEEGATAGEGVTLQIPV